MRLRRTLVAITASCFLSLGLQTTTASAGVIGTAEYLSATDRAGQVASVQASVDAGLEYGKDAVIDHFVIPNITMEVITAIGGSIGDFRQAAALGVIETFSAASCVVAADAAAKAAEVDVLDVRLAMGLGGKAFCLLSGDVGAVEQAVGAGAAMAAAQGLLVRQVVIPGVAPEVLRYIL